MPEDRDMTHALEQMEMTMRRRFCDEPPSGRRGLGNFGECEDVERDSALREAGE
jgi:hypothetical protein